MLRLREEIRKAAMLCCCRGLLHAAQLRQRRRCGGKQLSGVCMILKACASLAPESRFLFFCGFHALEAAAPGLASASCLHRSYSGLPKSNARSPSRNPLVFLRPQPEASVTSAHSPNPHHDAMLSQEWVSHTPPSGEGPIASTELETSRVGDGSSDGAWVRS